MPSAPSHPKSPTEVEMRNLQKTLLTQLLQELSIFQQLLLQNIFMLCRKRGLFSIELIL